MTKILIIPEVSMFFVYGAVSYKRRNGLLTGLLYRRHSARSVQKAASKLVRERYRSRLLVGS